MPPASVLVLVFLLPLLAAGGAPRDAASVLSPEVRETAASLRERALAGSRASEWVRGLTDRAGARLAGSPGDREAVAWGL